MEFYKYFLQSNMTHLENVSFETLEKPKIDEANQIKMNCSDTVVAQLSHGGVKINFNRKVAFEPEKIFSLSVTFSVFLPYRKEVTEAEKVELKGQDIAGAFREAGGPVLNTLMSKTSLLIGEITNAAGQNPLITPPNIK